MQFNIIFKTIFEYIHKKFRFVHTNTFCEYRKKLRASPRVHLVNKLYYKKHLCPLILRLLMNSYCSQKMRIRWNGAYSGTFTICNGVKQGGVTVLSPLLFNIYLEELEAQELMPS